MNILDWEYFETYLSKGFFQVTDFGPLHSPIQSFELTRDSNLDIILTTKLPPNAQSNFKHYQPGTVRETTETVLITGMGGQTIKLSGVQPTSMNGVFSRKTGEDHSIQISNVHSVELLNDENLDAGYTIDWVANIDHSYFIWPHSVEEEIVNTTTRIFSGKDGEIISQYSEGFSNHTNCCMKIILANELEVIVGKRQFKEEIDKLKPGYFIYRGSPTEELRKKIRNCFSFILGRPFVYLGYTQYSSNWKIISFKAISGYSIDGKAFTLATTPPSPIGARGLNDIHAEKFQIMANALFANYDALGFSHLIWLYWHAVCSPMHMAPAHFGALIEAVQNIYIKQHSKKFATSILKRSEWKSFRLSVLKLVEELNLDKSNKKILENKIGSLNKLPQSLITENFFQALDLNISDIEKLAWDHRNNAAHGNEIAPENYVDVIRETKLLKLLFHRILLRITGASDSYFDYYSLNFPIKEISESIS